mmetsp:Transcript_30295/g.91046  ORF Transcript_30295/g.91046 Transcript_30295/m.91046 type:complete len:172 (-) Transcript_30295:44-559(-)
MTTRLPLDTPTDEMKALAEEEIPEALEELGQKHTYVNDVIQWCEASYQTGDKNEIQAQTKEYLVDAVETVAKEVEATSAKLLRFLSLQSDAVDGLAIELDVVKERLALAKTQNAQARLQAFRGPKDDGTPSRPRLEVLNETEREAHMPSVGAYDRDVRARLAAFDDVGTGL